MDEHDYAMMLDRLEGARRYPGLEQLMCLALADVNFAADLLIDPPTALEHLPHAVELTAVEHDLAASISGATDIYDFAARLHERVAGSYPAP